MSICDSCARILTCPRPETRAVRLALVEQDKKILAEYIAERLAPGEVVPCQLYVEYVLYGSASPYQVARRIYAVFFRTAEDYLEYASFMDMFDTALKGFPEQFLMLVQATLTGAFQLYEWEFYRPHVERFGRLAKAASLDHLASGMTHADALLTARVPCSYLNLTAAVEVLKANPPKSVEEAKALIEASIEASKSRSSKRMSHEEFMEAMPMGGIN